MSDVPEHAKRIAELRREGKPYNEIAEITGYTIGPIGKWCNRLVENNDEITKSNRKHVTSKERKDRIEAMIRAGLPRAAIAERADLATGASVGQMIRKGYREDGEHQRYYEADFDAPMDDEDCVSPEEWDRKYADNYEQFLSPD